MAKIPSMVAPVMTPSKPAMATTALDARGGGDDYSMAAPEMITLAGAAGVGTIAGGDGDDTIDGGYGADAPLRWCRTRHLPIQLQLSL